MHSRRYILFVLLIASCLIYRAQYPAKKFEAIKNLKAVDGLDTIKDGYSIVYGSFVHRMTGASQKERHDEIRLKNVETGEVYAMRMSPYFYRDKRYYIMIFHILPGTYILTDYYFTRPNSIISGWKVTTEPILKTNSEISDTLNSNKFAITIKENSVNFIGNWSFRDKVLEFNNRKGRFDSIINKTYIRLNLNSANVAMPR